jgi:hypothetical protein
MILGICPKCASYEVLQVKSLSCGNTICLCDSCSTNLNEEELQPKGISPFAKNLIASASNLADKNDKYGLNAIKSEARKLKDAGVLKAIELLQIERLFVSVNPT